MKLLIAFLLLSFNILSQVEIVMSKEIDSLIKLRCNKDSKKYYTIPGWRVQLDFSVNKLKLKEIREKFISYHPEIETSLTFDSPYWKVLVGNFENINDAEKLIKEIRIHYPNLFLVEAPVYKNKDYEYVREESDR